MWQHIHTIELAHEKCVRFNVVCVAFNVTGDIMSHFYFIRDLGIYLGALSD